MSIDSAPGVPAFKDSWDGYGVERRELMSYIGSNAIPNVSFLTGDIHVFFAGDVGVDGRGPESYATEFVGGSISSFGLAGSVDERAGVSPPNEEAGFAGENIRATNPHLKYTEQKSRGYGILEASRDELLVEFKAVDALTKGATTTRSLGRFRVESGRPRVQTL